MFARPKSLAVTFDKQADHLKSTLPSLTLHFHFPFPYQPLPLLSPQLKIHVLLLISKSLSPPFPYLSFPLFLLPDACPLPYVLLPPSHSLHLPFHFLSIIPPHSLLSLLYFPPAALPLPPNPPSFSLRLLIEGTC